MFNETETIYSALLAGQLVSYGTIGLNEDDALTTYIYDPPISVPIALPLNQPHTLTSTQIGNDATSYPFSQEHTYLGRENINVAAGNFETCKISIKTTIDGFTQEVQTWYVANGPYRGIHVKSEFELPVIGMASSEATQIQADFK